MEAGVRFSTGLCWRLTGKKLRLAGEGFEPRAPTTLDRSLIFGILLSCGELLDRLSGADIPLDDRIDLSVTVSSGAIELSRLGGGELRPVVTREDVASFRRLIGRPSPQALEVMLEEELEWRRSEGT